jgi:threonine/homoserine/homoserine lactone efflux protein
MTWAFLEGLGMGIILSMMIGPVFFALIQASIENGFRHAVFMALGIFFSDAIYVLIAYFGVTVIVGNPVFKTALGYLGGLILIGLGLVSWRSKRFEPNQFQKSVPLKKRRGFLKGFGLNGINPFVLLFWVSVAGIVNLKTNYGPWDKLIYYLTILLTGFSLDLVKSYMARQLSRHITPAFIKKMNRIVAILLVLFGIRLIFFAFQHQLIN